MNRVVSSQRRAGPTHDSTGVDGTYAGMTVGHLCNLSEVLTIGGEAACGPRNDDDCCAPRPRCIRCYNWGCWDLLVVACYGRRGRKLVTL